MRNTIPKYSAFLLFISIVILFSCRKFDAFKNKEAPEEKFSVAAAKEWFYGKFKKSASYSEEVESIFSLHTVAVTARRKQYRKYPLWNQAVAYRNGDMSVVEAPLFMEANTILLPGMQAATAAERKRVAAATLHKVVLVQTGTQQMDVRIISIIPTLEYLQAHSYDISNNTARSVAPDFEGFYVVRGWNNSVYRFLEVKQGKIVRSVTIVTTGSRVAAQRTSHTDPAAAMQNSSGMCGEWVWVPYLQQVCVRTALCEGDIPCPELPCEEWEEIEKYRLEFQVDPDCVGGGGSGGGGTGDPFSDCLLTGSDYNTCLCWVWGICDGGGGDTGGGEDPPEIEPNPCDVVENLGNNHEYKEKFNELKNKVSDTKEHGYIFDYSGPGLIEEIPIIGKDAEAGIDFFVQEPIDGFVHSHYTGLLSVFSPDDLYAFAVLYLNNLMVNPKTFTAGVVTANGTQYIIMIDDLNKFQQFASNMVNNSTLDLYSHMYRMLYGIKPTNSNEANEKAFLQYIQQSNSGLKLFKGDANFNNWQPKKVDGSGNIVNDPC